MSNVQVQYDPFGSSVIQKPSSNEVVESVVTVPTEDQDFSDLLDDGNFRRLKKNGYTMTGILQTALEMSTGYQSAMAIFSVDSKYGPRFIALLQSIISSASLPENTISNRKNENNFVTAYNQLASQITSLLGQYYEFINTLPKEQVEQLADAGLNSAITGAGVTPSVLSAPDSTPVQGVANTTPEESASAVFAGISGVLNFAGTFFNIFSGAAALPKALTAMDLSNDLSEIGIDSANLGLQIDEESAKNRQEVHDVGMATAGYVPRESVFGQEDYGPTMQGVSQIARDNVAVSKAYARAAKKSLSSTYNIEDRKMSGVEVIEQMSQFNIVAEMCDSFCRAAASHTYSQFAEVASYLELQAKMSSDAYTSDYYDSISGSAMGISTQTVAENNAAASMYQPNIAEIQARLANTQLAISRIQKLKLQASYAFANHWFDLSMKDPRYAPFAAYGMAGLPVADMWMYSPELGQFGTSHAENTFVLDYAKNVGETLNEFKDLIFGFGSKNTKYPKKK